LYNNSKHWSWIKNEKSTAKYEQMEAQLKTLIEHWKPEIYKKNAIASSNQKHWSTIQNKKYSGKQEEKLWALIGTARVKTKGNNKNTYVDEMCQVYFESNSENIFESIAF
jgi:hypothetical protein